MRALFGRNPEIRGFQRVRIELLLNKNRSETETRERGVDTSDKSANDEPTNEDRTNEYIYRGFQYSIVKSRRVCR